MSGNIYDRISERRKREEQEQQERELEEKMAAERARYLTNELSFVRPDNLKDKTFHVFTLTDVGPSPFSLVVGRSPVESEADLETLTQQLVDEIEKSLSHFQWVVPTTPATVAGIAARRLEFRWRQQGKPVHQVQLIFLHEDELTHPVLMQITGTSNDPKGMTDPERTAFEKLVETAQLRSLATEEAPEAGNA